IGNVLVARAEGNGNGNNGNQVRCYNCIVRPRRRDAAYLQTQLSLIRLRKFIAQTALMANLQQASGHREEQYSEILEPIPEPHQGQQNDSNVIPVMPSVEQSRGTVEQNLAFAEETRALYDSLYNNLAIEVEKVNSVNHKMKETNAELTTELARYKNQEKCFEIN
ncbi:hypothetical protein Tco_1410505, partial [Tanacetum coccineum]